MSELPISLPARALNLMAAGGELRSEIERLRVAAVRTRLLGADPSGRDFSVRRLQRNLVLLNAAVRRAARLAPPSDEVKRAALFVARSYEQLAELPELDAMRLRLTAAVHYELAGFQANAATMARLAVPLQDVNPFEPADLAELASMFLQRRFLGCRLAGERQGSPAIPDDVDHGFVVAAALSLACAALGRASSYFLDGNAEVLNQAGEDLSIARDALLDLGDVYDTNLIEGLGALFPRLQATSTWTTLSTVLPDSPLWNRYLRALGRGFGKSAIEARSISELWPSQIAALHGGILDGNSHVVRMPTSAGKTRIAEIAIVHALAARQGSKALYVAPFNALTNDVESGFNNLFSDLGLSLSSLTGSFESSAVDVQAAGDDLLIVTPEKLDQLLRNRSEFLDELDLVVLDEGHIVGDETRGPKYELTVSRLRRRRPEARFVVLSAVVPDETLEDFSRWLRAAGEPISSDWRPTEQRLARLDWDGTRGSLVYPGAAGDLTVESVVRTQQYPYRHPATGAIRRPRFPEPTHRAQLAAAFAWQVIDQGPVLVYCGKPQDASSVARALSARFGWAEARDEAPPKSLSRRARRSALVAEEWLGADHEITKCLQLGIGVHHAGLPAAVKSSVEDDFRDRNLSLLAATATLAQGVNLPVRTLIVHTTRRFDEEQSATVQLPARDFWNIAGRVGRAGAETEGTVVFLSLNQTDAEDCAYYQLRRGDVEPVTSALYSLLQSLVSARLSNRDVARILDAEMLALLVEEETHAVDAAQLAEILGNSLFAVQSFRSQTSAAPLWNVMAATSRAIRDGVPDLGARAVYASTGLSAVSCVRVHQHVRENLESLRSEFETPTAPSSDLLSLLLTGLSQAREMTPRHAFDGSHQDLLAGWMDGEPVSGLASRYDADAMALTKFVEDFFGYRLPWGISGYLSIAAFELGFAEVPQHLLSVPVLVRYGVPSVTAAWAMSLGVPARGVAQQLGSRYEGTTTSPTSGGLRRWLSGLELEELEDLGMSADSVAAAAKVVLRAHGNSALRAHYEGRPLYPLSAEITLANSLRVDAIRGGIAVGDDLELRRDYDSANRNAVRLSWEGQDLGRLSRQVADAIALDLDAGLDLVAEIIAVRGRRLSLSVVQQ
jgi:hypothetical protein